MMENRRVFKGILFILGGVALILNRLGYFPELNLFSAIISIFLLSISIKNIRRRDFPGILFPLAFIGIIYSEQLGIRAITPWTLLVTTTLVSIGLSMIFNKRDDYFRNNNFNIHREDDISTLEEGHLRIQTSFGESIKYLKVDDFKAVSLDCSFGSMKIYFDNIELVDGKGIVNIDASFSGIELYIPREWKVVDNTSVSFGGVKEKNRNLDLNENTLLLIGDVSFSGVDIIYI